MSIIAEQAKSKDHDKIVTPGPGIMYVPKLKPKHKTPQVDVKNKGLRIWIFFVNAQWWMNILEWIDLNPIVFGGWASPLISSSFYFYSFKLWCMGAFLFYISPLFTLKRHQNGKISQIKMAVDLRVILPLFYFAVSDLRTHTKRSNSEGSYVEWI